MEGDGGERGRLHGEEFVRSQRGAVEPAEDERGVRGGVFPRGLHAPRHGGVRADGATEMTSTRPRHVVEVQDGDVAEDAGSASAAEDEKFARGGRVRAARENGGGGVHLSRGSGACPRTVGRTHRSAPSSRSRTWTSPMGPSSGLEPP